MTPEQIERVFGRGRLKMATGEHVEVFREAVAPGERRRYTKRFLATSDGDFGPWTEREWRILARLIGHGIRCVPDVVQFDGGAMGGMRLVQTYDAGVTVDQWATLLPVARSGAVRRHVFEDCAHWWALAHHCLAALNEIHALELIHLDIKGDNICIPYGPADFDPDSSGIRLVPAFARLALIDFAFSLVSRESLATPLPIGWQKDYDYQSPRLLRALEAGRGGDLEPTQELDWRCDFYSLAAMLKRYLPANSRAHAEAGETGWTPQRYDDARTLIFRLRESHDRDLPHWRPHAELMDLTGARLDERDLAASLDGGWMLARDAIAAGTATPMTPITPLTRIARSARIAGVTPMTYVTPYRVAAITPLTRIVPSEPDADSARIAGRIAAPAAAVTMLAARAPRPRLRATKALALFGVTLAALAMPSFVGGPDDPLVERVRAALAGVRSLPGPPPSETRQVATASTPDEGPGATTSRRAQDEGATTSMPAQDQGAPSSALAREHDATTSMPTPNQDTATSMPGVGSPPAAAATPAGDEPHVGASSAMRNGNEATRPVTKSRAKAGAVANRAQAAKGSSPPASATASARKRPSVPSTAIADAAGRSKSRQGPLQSARVLPTIDATPTLPGPPSSGPTASASSEPSSASTDQRAAPPSVATQQLVVVESLSAGNEEGRTSASANVSPAGGVEATASDQRAEQPATPKKPRSAPQRQPQPRDEWQALLDNVFGFLRGRVGPPAPIEERSVQSSPAARPGATPRAPVRPGSGVLAQAAPTPPRAQSSPPARPAPTAPSPAAAAPEPAATPAPLTIEPMVPASPSPSVALAESSSEPRVQTVPAPAAALPPPGAEPRVQVRPAPAAPFPALIADARAQAMRATPAPIAGPPPPTAGPPTAGPPGGRAWDDGQDVWVMQARRALAETVPRVAAQAQPDVSRVLWAAALANHPYQTQAVVEAASARWASEVVWIPASNVAPTYARRLHNDARQAMASGRDVSDAVNLELRAFGANPRDADIAGYLAFLHLRTRPVQPETARQLTLHAIAVSGSRRSARSDDWGTLAVASALTGRESDAIRAYLAEIALSSDIDRSCRTALSAYASFGERLRVPVQAMLYRVYSLGRDYAYPSCAWPSYWSAATRWSGAY